ncbi:site-specific integrase [Lysobacter sp. CCNWLW3]|uniref:site-specific integrase n=1 Tax=unclassified Lysobacter TaxID=2635362 RepID=UPI002FD419D5
MARITREALTRKTVEAAKTTGKLYRLRDATVPGLLLRVNATGKRTWAVTWGRGQERIIGTYPVMTLEGARDAARRELGEVAEHGAPVAVIEANKPAAEKPITLGDFVADHYAPWAKAHQKAGQATVDALKACFGDLYERELRSLSAFDVERFKAKRLKAKRKPATVNRDLDRIRSVFSRAVEWGFLSDHPLKAVKRAKGADNSRVRYLTADEEKRLRDALAARETERRASRERHNAWHAARGSVGHPQWPKDGFTDHLMPLVLVARNTGLRRGELFGLSWSDVNLPGKLLTVTAGNAKSRKARHVPLNAEAVDVLKRWKKQGDAGGLVFPSAGGGRLTNVNKSWDGLGTGAKLTDFRFHDLRHDFASKLVMAGVDLNTVRELLGHADIAMTLRYSHLAPDKLADAVAKLGVKR